jgi:hypothetical protein
MLKLPLLNADAAFAKLPDERDRRGRRVDVPRGRDVDGRRKVVHRVVRDACDVLRGTGIHRNRQDVVFTALRETLSVFDMRPACAEAVAAKIVSAAAEAESV